MKKNLIIIAAIMVCALTLAACAGPEGPEGPTGPAGLFFRDISEDRRPVGLVRADPGPRSPHTRTRCRRA